MGGEITVQFSKKWVKEDSQSRLERLKDSVKPEDPLKTRVEEARRLIQVQSKKLNSNLTKIKARDSFIFEKMTTAVQKHDINMCSALSKELADVRRTAKILSQTTVILDQLIIRLNTFGDKGDLVSNIAPVVGSIRNVQSGLAKVMPEAENAIGEIGSVLSDVVMNAGRLEGLTLDFKIANEDAEKILAEATAIADQKMESDFPKLPNLTKKISSDI